MNKKATEKYVYEGPMVRGPHFLVRLRSHTVYENTSVKLFCTIDGFPLPIVRWLVKSCHDQTLLLAKRIPWLCLTVAALPFRYKDDVTLDTSSGRYLVEVKGGVHSLEIPRSASQNDAFYWI